jgi:hypothetical protein
MAITSCSSDIVVEEGLQKRVLEEERLQTLAL